jgi:hypothetical protein
MKLFEIKHKGWKEEMTTKDIIFMLRHLKKDDEMHIKRI